MEYVGMPVSILVSEELQWMSLRLLISQPNKHLHVKTYLHVSTMVMLHPTMFSLTQNLTVASEPIFRFHSQPLPLCYHGNKAPSL